MKITIYDNYHAGISMLPTDEQDAFYGAIARYAFEGVEPELEGVAAAIWATIKTLVDKSLEGQANGAKGGNGRGNKADKNPTAKPIVETQTENPTVKPSNKTPQENPTTVHDQNTRQKNQIKRKEGNGRENSENFSSIPPVYRDATAAGAASRTQEPSTRPVCPLCSRPVTYSPLNGKWKCQICGDIKEAVYAEWKEDG